MPTLTWIGKEAVVDHHKRVPMRLLECDPKLSAGDPDAGNLLIQGDNLEALKALLPRYKGQVKCIYIDPPYNTGNEGWIYNDNVNDPRIKKWLGEVVGKEAEDLCRHDKWLCMMYPRLRLLRDFLREDGSIWVSMDDNEIQLLRLLMDDIFGRDRFVACCVWQKRYSRENRGGIGDAHEYVLVYANNPTRFKEARNLVPLDEKSAKPYKNFNNDPRGRWRAIPMNAQGFRPNQMYEILTPSGKVKKPPKGRCWSMVEPEFKKLLAQGRIWFGKKGNSAPGEIRYLSEVGGLVPWTWWPHTDAGHTDEAKKEVGAFLHAGVAFDTPKPVRLIRRVLEIATDKHGLILDSFVGSGTTIQATLELNKSDGGSRRVIAIEIDEDIAVNVTSRRIQSVVQACSTDSSPTGVHFCRLGKALLDGDGEINQGVPFTDLGRYVYLVESGMPAPTRPRKGNPLLGVHDGRAIYLLYNGVLGDKRPAGGNVLTHAVLDGLPLHPDGPCAPRVVYGEACRLSDSTLSRNAN